MKYDESIETQVESWCKKRDCDLNRRNENGLDEIGKLASDDNFVQL